MEFNDLIEKRVSVRKFSNKPVDEGLINCILKVIQRCPTAGNLQSFRVFLIRDDGIRKKLVNAAGGQDFIAEAPISLVFCALPEISSKKYRKRGRNLYSIQDATIACTFGMLAAVDNGLGCVWVGAFDVGSVQKALGCSRKIIPVAILPIGFSDETPGRSSRRNVEEIVSFLD
jgi:nitroreductase